MRLSSVTFRGPTDLPTIVGERGERITAVAANYAPYLNHPGSSARLALNGRIELDIQTIDEEGDPVRVADIEYNVVRKDRIADWKRLRSIPFSLPRPTLQGTIAKPWWRAKS